MADDKNVVAEKLNEIAETATKGIKAAEDRISAAAKEDIKKAQQAAVEEARGIIKSLEEKYNKEIGDIQEKHTGEVKSLKDDIKELKQQNGTLMSRAKAGQSIGDAVMEKIKSPEIMEKIKAIKSGGSNGMVSFDIEVTTDMVTKAVHTMVRGTDVTGGDYILSDVTPGTTRVLRRRPFIRSIVSVGRTGKQFVKYTEITNPEGGAGMTAEGTTKTQASFQYVTRSIEVKKITAFIKVSDEFLEDVDEAEQDIRQELIELVELKLDDQLLSGDGTSNNIKGIDAWSVAWTGTQFYDNIVDANEADVVRAGIAKMTNSYLNPSHVLMNPVDAALLDMAKGSDGQYQRPGYMVGNTIDGVQIVENPGVAAGTAYLIDASKLKLKIRKDLTVQVGLDADDFTKNLVTFRAEMRAAMYLPTNHSGAVVKINLTATKKYMDEASS